LEETTLETEHNIRLTSAEIANLWTNYMHDSLGSCVLSFFLEKTEDTEIKSVLDYALSLSKKHIQTITDLLNHEDYPIPVGFTTNDDVDFEAPRLFSDTFHLHYVYHMTKMGLTSDTLALSLAARSDIRDYYSECIASSIELQHRAVELLLRKGIYIRPPYITTPKSVDFVQHQNFLTGWFGERKPLLAMEIMQLHHNIQTNAIGKAVVMGFSQVAKTADVRDYMVRGKKISTKHIEIFGSLLTDNDLPVPMTWDSDVMDSTVPPFSDKLMMFHVFSLNSAGMGNYGTAISTTTRRDLVTHYIRLNAEIGQYVEDGVNIMIKRGWMEQPPQSIDRDEIAKE